MTTAPTEIIAAWKGDLNFTGQDASGATVQMGSSESRSGMTPMQLLLVSLAGCTGMDIVSILQKKRAPLSDLQVKVRGRRAADYPRIWTSIHVSYLIWGEGIAAADVMQAVRLSESKYCSVWAMLGQAASVTSEYQIFKPGETAESRSEE